MQLPLRFLTMLTVIGCLCLCGCGMEPADTTDSMPVPTQTGSVTVPDQDPTEPRGEAYEVEFSAAGAVKVEYSVNISSARYITAADRLPDVEALKKYDEAYFQDKALLIVYETVSSGTARPVIGSLRADGIQGWVTLSREAQGGATIPVMTTWLLWAEVDQDLPRQWTVTNPALDSNTQTS